MRAYFAAFAGCAGPAFAAFTSSRIFVRRWTARFRLI
jgi:hypothetical protein